MIYASKAVKLVVCAAILAFPAVAAHPNALKISELESLGRYKKVIESYANDDSAMALCIQGDYLYHGRKGIQANKDRGMELYKKALELLVVDAEAGN